MQSNNLRHPELHLCFLFLSVVTLPQVLDVLLPAGKITQEVADNTLTYLRTNRSVCYHTCLHID